MITHRFSIMFGLSLCSFLIAQEQQHLAPSSCCTKNINDSDDNIDLQIIFSKEPILESFYQSLSTEEQDDFVTVVKNIKATINQALSDFAQIAEAHAQLIEKLKSFLGEENFVVSIGLTKGSDTTPITNKVS